MFTTLIFIISLVFGSVLAGVYSAFQLISNAGNVAVLNFKVKAPRRRTGFFLKKKALGVWGGLKARMAKRSINNLGFVQRYGNIV